MNMKLKQPSPPLMVKPMTKRPPDKAMNSCRYRMVNDEFSSLEYNEAVAIAQRDKKIVKSIRETRAKLLAKEINGNG